MLHRTRVLPLATLAAAARYARGVGAMKKGDRIFASRLNDLGDAITKRRK